MLWVPGRIALVGEHNDWAGGAAVVVPHRRGVTVEVTPSAGLRVEAIMEGRPLFWSPGEPIGVLGLVPAVLEVLGLPFDLPAKIHIRGDLPPGRGFSSSAAVSVGLVRVLWAFTGQPPPSAERVARFAWRAEHEGLGVNCGLLDPLACSFGCPLYLEFTPDARVTRVEPIPARLTLVVGSFSAPRDTPGILAALGGARQLPHVQAAFSGFGQAARQVVPSLRDGDLAATGRAMNHCQDLYERELQQLPALAAPGLMAAVRAARDAGASGAKFSGAGGDGSVVALVSPDQAMRVVEALVSLGLSAEVVEVGAPGTSTGGAATGP